MCHLIASTHTDRKTGPTALLLLACAGSSLFAACEAPSGAGGGSPPAQVVLEEVRFQAWRGGDPALSGTAERIVYRKSSGDVEATRVVAAAERPGQPPFSVDAPRVEGGAAGGAWTASGGVTLVRGTSTARTPSARWSEADGLVRGDESVVVEGPGYRIEGPAFVADPRSGDVAVTGGARLVAGGEAR